MSMFKDKKTIFSSLLRIWTKIRDLIWELEYAYETSLIPSKTSSKYRLDWNLVIFLKTLRVTLKNIASKKFLHADIVLPLSKSQKNKPRVIHLIVWLGGIGGAPKMILDIVNGLGGKYDMEGITLSDDFYFKYSNFNVKHFSSPAETIKYLLSNPPDILHTYYYGDWKKFHQNFEKILNSRLNSAIIENLLAPIHIYRSSRIDFYVYCSNYIREMQYEKFENESVIYPGVNIEEYRPSSVNNRPDSVGMVYRLWDDKIDQSTIEMFISLAKKRPKTLIYIVGKGFNFHHYTERTRQEGVRNSFYFRGEVGYKELPLLYDKFGIFVAPIHNESYGLVVPYAMAKNIPVVAYRRGALPELLGDTNRLVNTSPEMVEALIKILDNPSKAKELTKNSRDRVIEKFSTEKMLSEYDKLYSFLINHRKKMNNKQFI